VIPIDDLHRLDEAVLHLSFHELEVIPLDTISHQKLGTFNLSEEGELSRLDAEITINVNTVLPFNRTIRPADLPVRAITFTIATGAGDG
jgi:hypothetical protein